LIASIAISVPITPVNAPRTPASAQDGTVPGAGRVGKQAAEGRVERTIIVGEMRGQQRHRAIEPADSAPVMQRQIFAALSGIGNGVARVEIVRAIDQPDHARDQVLVLAQFSILICGQFFRASHGPIDTACSMIGQVETSSSMMRWPSCPHSPAHGLAARRRRFRHCVVHE
jgi:hypothetical protein